MRVDMEGLPLETLARIFELLEIGDAARLAATCKFALAAWRSQGKNVWRRRWLDITRHHRHAIGTSIDVHPTHHQALHHLGHSAAYRNKIEARIEERDALAYHAPVSAMLDVPSGAKCAVWVVYAPHAHRRQAPQRARDLALSLYGRVDDIVYGNNYPSNYYVDRRRGFLCHLNARVSRGVKIYMYPDGGDRVARNPRIARDAHTRPLATPICCTAIFVVVDAIEGWLLERGVRGIVNLSRERMRLWRGASPAVKQHFRRHHLLNMALTDKDRHHFRLLVSAHGNDPYASAKALSYALVCNDLWTQVVVSRVRAFVANHHAPHSVVKLNRSRCATDSVWWCTVNAFNDSWMSPDDHDFFRSK